MYQLRLKPWVSKQIDSLPERIQKDVAEILLDPRDEPMPVDSSPMREKYEGFRRIRVDGYRIVYRIENNVVMIGKIAPRTRKTYNHLAH